MSELFFEILAISLILSFLLDVFGIAYTLAKKSAHAKIIERKKEMIRSIKQERHGEQYYWFDAETDRFITQGKNYEEIVEGLRARFPRHVFIINDSKMMVGPTFEVVDINEENIKKLEI